MPLDLQPPAWSFLPQSVDGPVRLAPTARGTPLLHLANGTQLTGISAPGALQTAPVEVPRYFEITPDFDVAFDADDTLLLAVEQFLGASNALLIGTVQDGAFQVTARFDQRFNYRHPRFVRGPYGAGFVTVAASRQLALVPRVADETIAAAAQQQRWFRTLPPGLVGCAIAHAPVTPSSPLTLLYLGTELFAGPYLRGAPPSALHLQTKAGERIRLLPAARCFTFDADAHTEGAVVVVQTTDGPRALAVDLDTGATSALAAPQDWTTRGRWIANPSVRAITAADGTRSFQVAAEEGEGDTVLGIRTGTIPIA